MGGIQLAVRGDTHNLEPQLRRALAEVDPNLTIISVQSMEQQVATNFDQQRMVAQLAGTFGVIALLLAAIGLYGLTAYTVARRTSEIGVRMALGADRMNIVRLVLRGAFLQVAHRIADRNSGGDRRRAADDGQTLRSAQLGSARSGDCRFSRSEFAQPWPVFCRRAGQLPPIR